MQQLVNMTLHCHNTACGAAMVVVFLPVLTAKRARQCDNAAVCAGQSMESTAPYASRFVTVQL
jgi:hypothetical protein